MFKSIRTIFSGKPEKVMADLSQVGVDMHSHLIPGIDDGAKTLDDSIELIKFMHGLGYHKLITTPHIMSDYFRNTPEIILSGLEAVREALKQHEIPVEIHAAAEYYIDDGFIRKLEEERLLTIGDNYLLVEVSYINPPDNIREILFRAQVLGYKPILAHPERYPFWYRSMNEYQSFRDMGVMLQINLNSLSGYYGPDAKRIAEKLIDHQMVDVLGSDLHHLKHAASLERTLYEKYLPKVLDGYLLNREL
jgi:tyrosine-protein phosphatase YwqE